MIPDNQGFLLHKRVTEGDQLSTEELATLNAWYKQQDEAESLSLNLEVDAQLHNTVQIQDQIELAMAQLINATNRLEEVSTQNEKLRAENQLLRKKVADIFDQKRA